MLRWNKAIWLDVPSHVTYFYQLECFIPALLSYATLNLFMTSTLRRLQKFHH